MWASCFFAMLWSQIMLCCCGMNSLQRAVTSFVQAFSTCCRIQFCMIRGGMKATFSVLEASEVKLPTLEGFVLPTSQVGRGTCPVMAKCILIPHKCKQIWAIKALLVYLFRRKNLTDLQPQPLPPHCPMDSVHPQDLLNRRVRRQVSDRVCLWSGQGNCGKIGLAEHCQTHLSVHPGSW